MKKANFAAPISGSLNLFCSEAQFVKTGEKVGFITDAEGKDHDLHVKEGGKIATIRVSEGKVNKGYALP